MDPLENSVHCRRLTASVAVPAAVEACHVDALKILNFDSSVWANRCLESIRMPNMAVADRPIDALGAIDGALRVFIPMVPPMETNGNSWKNFDRKFFLFHERSPYELLMKLSACRTTAEIESMLLQALIETIPLDSDLYIEALSVWKQCRALSCIT